MKRCRGCGCRLWSRNRCRSRCWRGCRLWSRSRCWRGCRFRRWKRCWRWRRNAWNARKKHSNPNAVDDKACIIIIVSVVVASGDGDRIAVGHVRRQFRGHVSYVSASPLQFRKAGEIGVGKAEKPCPGDLSRDIGNALLHSQLFDDFDSVDC